jgi:hypothetical protein
VTAHAHPIITHFIINVTLLLIIEQADELYRENTKEIRANRESTQEMKDALIVRQRKYVFTIYSFDLLFHASR